MVETPNSSDWDRWRGGVDQMLKHLKSNTARAANASEATRDLLHEQNGRIAKLEAAVSEAEGYEERLDSLERSRDKVRWMVGGAVTLGSSPFWLKLWQTIKEALR